MALDKLLRALKREAAVPPGRRREMLQTLGYDWHPGLRGGRVNNENNMDGGKPRLFICKEHEAGGITRAVDIERAYLAAQEGK